MSSSIRRYVIWGLCLMVLSACGGSDTDYEVPPVGVPTRTLPPATPTPTVGPDLPAPVPTLTDLPSPLTLFPVTTPAGGISSSSPFRVLVEQARDDLITRLSVDPAGIRLISLEAITWPDRALGCATNSLQTSEQSAAVPGYRILFSAGTRLYIYYASDQGDLVWCQGEAWRAREGRPIPPDPVAEAMVEWAARDAARRLAVPYEQVELTGLLSVTWPDSSLGCPRPGGLYQDTLTPGYWLEFKVGEQTLVYHTSVREVMVCAPGEEVLPGLLEQALRIPALPTPQPD